MPEPPRARDARETRARKSLLEAVGRVDAREQSIASLVGDFDRWLSSFAGLEVQGVG